MFLHGKFDYFQNGNNSVVHWYDYKESPAQPHRVKNREGREKENEKRVSSILCDKAEQKRVSVSHICYGKQSARSNPAV